MGIVILHRKDPTLGRLSALQQSCSIDRGDAIEINHANGYAGCLQLVIGLQGFEQRHTSRDDRQYIRGALSEDLAAADLKLLFWSIND